MTRYLAAALLLCALAGSPARAQGRDPNATLGVRSSPAGAQILLDGVAAGTTPRLFHGVAPGAHQVELRLEGRRAVTRQVRLRRRERRTLSATLVRLPKLPPAELARRKAAVQSGWGRLREWSRANQLGVSPPGLAGAAGTAAQDPLTGLYLSVSEEKSPDGTPVLSLGFFLDAALTQPAGTATAALGGDALVLDFAFTAGPLAGDSGHLTAQATGDGAVSVSGTGLLADGTAWSSDYHLALAGSGTALSGSGDFTAPDGGRYHWELTGGPTGSDYRLTLPDGSTLLVHAAPDGSGSGELRSPSGDLLATFTWTPDGQLTVTYPDGSQ